MSDIFPTLLTLSKEFEPDCSPASTPKPELAVHRITAENPLASILNRLQQFTSVTLARRLVERRAEHESVILSKEQVHDKASAIAYSMRHALDYTTFSSKEKLNKRILSLYYGSMAFAFAEMLPSPSGPISLDEVEQITKSGHGLYTLSSTGDGFADVHVGILGTGFLPQWLAFLGQEIGSFPRRRPKGREELNAIPQNMRVKLNNYFHPCLR